MNRERPTKPFYSLERFQVQWMHYFNQQNAFFAEPMALATIAAGADGITFEIHKEPENTASNGAQILNFKKNFSKQKSKRIL